MPTEEHWRVPLIVGTDDAHCLGGVQMRGVRMRVQEGLGVVVKVHAHTAVTLVVWADRMSVV